MSKHGNSWGEPGQWGEASEEIEWFEGDDNDD